MAARQFLLLLILFIIPCTNCQPLKSPQLSSLLHLSDLLGSPSFLSLLPNSSNPCTVEPSPSFTVICYNDDITQLHISGLNSTLSLPTTFSLSSFFTTLSHLQSLKVLSLTSLGLFGALPGKQLSTLLSLEILNLSLNSLSGPLPDEICSLTNLQSLILDHNQLSGELPANLGKLTQLSVLSASDNSFSGQFPSSISTIESLRMITFPKNSFSGQLPDLKMLTNLQIVDFSDNSLGPDFPKLGNRISAVILKNNSFTGSLPNDLHSFHLLQKLDLSLNRFVGPFQTSLLSLPSIKYLDISKNKFTGLLLSNLSCNDGLEFVNISFNLFDGSLPKCLVRNNVSYMMNCLSDGEQPQKKSVFCRNEALAVGVIPRKRENRELRRYAGAVAAVTVTAMAAVGLMVVGGLFVVKRVRNRKGKGMYLKGVTKNASNGYSSRQLLDARYISLTMKLGALGIPPYRTFSLEELQEATNNFEKMAFLDKASQIEMYHGRLHDRSMVAISCLKLKKGFGSRSLGFTRYIEIFSKLRHHHLVSALGHGFEYHLDDSSISRIFLVFEHVTNGTLRSHLCEKNDGNKLTWCQRISAAIGVVKGIQFLHAGIIPGLCRNSIKATDVLLDHNQVTKICCYNLPIMAEILVAELGAGGCPSSSKGSSGSDRSGEKEDVYDFGVILLELITGEPITPITDVNKIKEQVEIGLTAERLGPTGLIMVDEILRGACCEKSLKTVMEICVRCLSIEPLERPSIEDILWNLQFAAQVQESWIGEFISGNDSPVLA